METYTVYRLTFKTQLHLGRTSGPAQEREFRLRKNRDLHTRGHSLFRRFVRRGRPFTTLRASQFSSMVTRKTTQCFHLR